MLEWTILSFVIKNELMGINIIYIYFCSNIYICICCQANIRAANCKLFVSFNSDVSIPSARIYTQKPDWYSNYTFQISWHQIKFRSMTNQPEKCNYNLNLVWFIKMIKNSTIFFSPRYITHKFQTFRWFQNYGDRGNYKSEYIDKNWFLSI